MNPIQPLTEEIASRVIQPDAVYTTKQGAALLQICPRTLINKIRAGLIRGKGRFYRIKGSELLKLT